MRKTCLINASSMSFLCGSAQNLSCLIKKTLVEAHKKEYGVNTLLLLEHPPTYTVGKRGAMYDETFEGM